MARIVKYTDHRNIRVFISSTFQDMKGERDYLIKKVFPQLRKIAAEYNATVTEVDLRWGITEEEANSKRVLELCFREIDNSIPFFIGILGDRYGWCPTKNDVSVYSLESYKQLPKYIDNKLSVTEMEIQYGVLEREEKIHAYFYIKDSKQKKKYANFDKLDSLKTTIKTQSRYPVSEYSTLKDLSHQVIKDFMDLISNLFPDNNLPNYTKQYISQEYVLNNLSHAYVPLQLYYDQLNDWIKDATSPICVIHGESGLGKSALLANWINTLNDAGHFDVCFYFTHNSRFVNSARLILYYIYRSLAILRDKFGYDNETEEFLNDNSGDPYNLLEDLLIKSNIEGFAPPIIVIDGIDQLCCDELSSLLGVLLSISKYSKVIVSTKNLDIIPELEFSANTSFLEIIPLLENQKKELVSKYLELYGKRMTDIQINRIVNDTQCNNTQILRSLLDELLTFGIFERLSDRIDYYLRSDSRGFYESMLTRYEEDFGFDIIQDILCLIYFSRKGLTEIELKAITKSSNLDFSEFLVAFNHQLISKVGRLSFSHNKISEEVYHRYIKGNIEEEIKYRELLIQYFQKKFDLYSLKEATWQIYRLKDYKRLFKLLIVYKNALKLAFGDYGLFIRYWKELYQNGYSLISYIKNRECQRDDNLLQCLSNVALSAINDPAAASQFRKQITTNFEQKSKIALSHVQNILQESMIDDCIVTERPFNPVALCNRAEIEYHKYNYEEALGLYKEAYDMVCARKYYEENDDTALSVAEIDILVRMADTYDVMKNKENAIHLYKKSLEKLRDLKDLEPELDLLETEITIYVNLGTSIYLTNPYKALDYLNEALDLQKTIGLNNHRSVGLLMNIGVIYDEGLNLNLKGLEYYKKALQIKLNLIEGEPDILMGDIYKNIALASKDKKEKNDAFEKSKEIFKLLKSPVKLSNVYDATATEFFNAAYYHRAFKDYLTCLKLRDKELGRGHSLTMSAFSNVMETLQILNVLDVPSQDDLNKYDNDILIAGVRLGYPNAEYELAVRYFEGEYLEEDKDTAIQLLTSSAQKGCLSAYKMLADIYFEGKYIAQDYSIAHKYWYLMAESGDYEGEYKLGICYEYGYGVDLDYKMAIEWYLKAAYKGYIEAYNPLAMLLFKQGNYDTSLKWAKSAVDVNGEDWRCYYTISLIYIAISQWEYALKYLNLCMNLQVQSNAPENVIEEIQSRIEDVKKNLCL